MTASPKSDIKSLQLDELLSIAQPSYRARQITDWLYKKRVNSFTEMTDLPQALRAQLAHDFSFDKIEVVRVLGSADTTRKFLFRLSDGNLIESVLIPASPALYGSPSDRRTICISTQVGCAYGCKFCASGLDGWKRNLRPNEILNQIIAVERESGERIDNIVFMGMGEPLLNYERVIRAARIFSESCGMSINSKAITISTVGIVPAIRRFTADRHRYRLIISLTAARTEQRQSLLPIEHVYPLPELLAAVREYHAATRKRVTFAWTILAGINTSRDDARALAELTRGLPILLDLIDVNDPTGRFRRPQTDEANAFRDALREELAMPVQRRYSGGQDIHGACGMLATTDGGAGEAALG